MVSEETVNPLVENFIRFTPRRGRLFISKSLRKVLGSRVEIFLDTQCTPIKIGIKSGQSFRVTSNEIQAVKLIYDLDLKGKDRISMTYDETLEMYVGEIPHKGEN